MRLAERGGIFSGFIFLMTLAFLAALLFVVRHPLLRAMGSFWVVDDPAPHADAMIVLSDDNFAGERAAHAADLYRRGVAPVIVASNRLLRPYVEIGDMMAHDLRDHGVPPSAIIKSPPHRAADTREEAEALRPFVTGRGWKRIVIVTSNYHTRRAGYIFGRVFPDDVAISTAAAPDSDYDPSRWWQARSGLKTFLYETTGYIVAHWELRNSPSTPAKNESLLFAWVFHIPENSCASHSINP